MATPYVGEIRLFAGNFAPVGWLLCQGQTLPITDYETLFQLIGTTYGGNGETTFNLPDLRGRVPVHQGRLSGAGSNYVLGQTGGAETVTLTPGQIGVHAHPVLCNAGLGTSGSPGGNFLAASPTGLYTTGGPDKSMAQTTTKVGGSQPHENRPPYLGLNFIIAVEGIFPTPS